MQTAELLYPQAQYDAIQAAAAKILSYPSFRTSERSSRLFRYLLEKSLSGEVALLRERPIGNEVFGRDIGYDTAADPIVRNAASEVRKRLRQYEAEDGTQASVHIQLPPGSYVLEIRFTEQHTEPVVRSELSRYVAEDPATHHPYPGGLIPAPLERGHSQSMRLAYAIALLATVGCVAFGIAFFHERSVLQQPPHAVLSSNSLWNPILRSGKEVFISLGHAEPLSDDDLSLQSARGGLQRVTLTDLKAYTNISGFLQLNDEPFQMRTDNQTSLLDLRDRPAIFIGIHNNDWTRRLLGNLRFHFNFIENKSKRSGHDTVLVDSEHPDQVWEASVGGGDGSAVDYALAGRVLNPVTGGIILYVAGAGTVGTQAAAEFVTQPRYLRNLPQNLNDPKTNIQIVLKIPVVSGIAGSPEVIATHVW